MAAGVIEHEAGARERADREAVPPGQHLLVERRRVEPGARRRIQAVVAALAPLAVDHALRVLCAREPTSAEAASAR